MERQIDDLNLIPERYKHKVFGVVGEGAVGNKDTPLPAV